MTVTLSKACAAPPHYLFPLCTACHRGAQLAAGACSPRSNASTTSGAARLALLSVADGVRSKSSAGALDLGYPVS